MLAKSDAALLIGDNALTFMQENELPDIRTLKPVVGQGAEPLQVFDLAERWRFLTGLPFVFAFWAVREGFTAGNVVDDLIASRDFGVANIPAIAEKYSTLLELRKDFLQAYLEQNVHYYMDNAGVEALELFYEKAASAGAIKSARSVQFV
jgi:chorismate dehydratase